MKSRKPIPWEFLGPLAGGLLLLILLFLLGGESETPIQKQKGYPAMEEISFEVGKKEMNQVRLIREDALRKQVLEVSEGDWVKGILKEKGKSWPVELRLKGDWTDHLEGGKWSFRVKVKGGGAFKRMKVFSLQNPATRNYLAEWYFHRALRQEGVLTPYYDFVRVRLNTAELGIYAIEQHFTKQLLESQGRREGPILKFSEDGMWEARRIALADPNAPYTDIRHYEAAHIEAFQYNRFLNPKDELPVGQIDNRKDLHRHGQKLLHAAKYDLLPSGQTFNLKRVAQQYALTDLFGGHHSLVWHNRRFYYDPIASRLEPIVYDAYAGPIGGKYLQGPFIGHSTNGNTYYNGREDRLGLALFREPTFLRYYYNYLKEYSSAAFLDDLWTNHGQDLNNRENFVRQEFLFYSYDRSALGETATGIRLGLKMDRDRILIEEDESGFCILNENPVPIELYLPHPFNEETASYPYVILDAWDGRNPADQFFVPVKTNFEFQAAVLESNDWKSFEIEDRNQ